MAVDYLVIGHFASPSAAAAAVALLRGSGTARLEVYSPVPNQQLESAVFVDSPRSPVRRFTLAGALAGFFGAYLATCWMSIDWPLRTSAKPIVSIPAFTVIAFECLVLVGGVLTLAALFHFCRLPNVLHTPGYRRCFSEDTFGVVARARKEEAPAVRAVLENAGAEFVEVEYVR